MQLTISFNGKARFQMQFAADAADSAVREAVLADERSQRYLEGKQVVKVIVVKGRLVNVVAK